MKDIKFQRDLITYLSKGEHLIQSETKGAIFRGTDQILMRLDNCYIDLRYFDEIYSFAAKKYNEVVSTYENEPVKIGRRKVTIVTLRTRDKEVGVDKKLLDYFEEPTMLVKNDSEPVFVFENGELCGLIMPIKLKSAWREK